MIIHRQVTERRVKRFIRVLNQNNEIIAEGDNIEDVAKSLDSYSSLFYKFKNTGEYFKRNINSDDLIKVEYYKDDYNVVVTESGPFILPYKYRTAIASLPGEIWRRIPGVPECNYASNMGRFKIIDDLGNEGFNTTVINRNKTDKIYHNVSIQVPDGNNYYVRASRVLAKTFIDKDFPIKKDGNEVVDHIDNDSTNDKITNLRIVDQSRNIYYAMYEQDANEFGMERIPVRCVDTGDEFLSMAEAARHYDIHLVSISSAVNGLQKTAGGYKWEAI